MCEQQFSPTHPFSFWQSFQRIVDFHSKYIELATTPRPLCLSAYPSKNTKRRNCVVVIVNSGNLLTRNISDNKRSSSSRSRSNKIVNIIMNLARVNCWLATWKNLIPNEWSYTSNSGNITKKWQLEYHKHSASVNSKKLREKIADPIYHSSADRRWQEQRLLAL